ncbi:ATP-binding cassette domain-containing protein [Seonamhaeicola sp. ML3]|uniref:ATP-binding cassette domain-containing protein n=1 Tax=Seonamhaeicola sp. ML3 TaxID=2937786 RepID=UPI00200C8FD9|nr:ATP-binding cassette domain-containing protein [Seonamhaeicola sp. ML3]
MRPHTALYISNKHNKPKLIKSLVSGELLPEIDLGEYILFSDITIDKLISEERRHGKSALSTLSQKKLQHASQGERRKALLKHIIAQKPNCIIVDNVFDSLDVNTQKTIKTALLELSNSTLIIQICNRKRDVLEFIGNRLQFDGTKWTKFKTDVKNDATVKSYFTHKLPQRQANEGFSFSELIRLRNINLSYEDRPILQNINWDIKPGEFWQLMGPNGSGKSTILNLISGDNPKGFMQDMVLFDMKKGSGESVWDIKKHIGFFSSDMLIGFKRRDSIENMIISGFYDSIGLYKFPTEVQIKIAQEWLKVLQMSSIRNNSFTTLSEGHKRLVLIARAMVKQPPLLILDEPTNGLDDVDAKLFSTLVNKIAQETDTAILYVSHRHEVGLAPDYIYELIPNEKGSIGRVVK